MKAVYIQRHGAIADLQVSEVPAPSIRSGEVLVKVEAAGINPSDIVSLEGRFPTAVLPRIVGRDFAGKVVEGPADLVGAEVWGSGGDLGVTRDGTHAEYLSLPRAAVARRPKSLSALEAAVAGVPFVAAFSALFRLGGFAAGQWVIVSGAAGAVGHAAVQLAGARGGRVIALVKDGGDQWVSQCAGVQAVARSDRGDLETVVREATGGKGVDLALNGVGGSIFGSLLASLRHSGRQVVYAAVGGREFNLDLFQLYRNQWALFGLDTQKLSASDGAEILNEIDPLFESGALTAPRVGEQYPLADAAKAYARAASGQAGKVVLVMS